jgi:hypothetical protein
MSHLVLFLRLDNTHEKEGCASITGEHGEEGAAPW